MSGFHFTCTECAAEYEEHEVRLVCPVCTTKQQPGGVTRGVLEVTLTRLPSSWPAGSADRGRFVNDFLPIADPNDLPSLPVGDTPLLSARRLREHMSMSNLWIKDDTRNPSGSTKDRASLLVVGKALEYGYDTVAAASTGNAATALAAVAATAGIRAVVFVPAKAPEAKLVQMLNYGATVLPVDGSYDDAFELCGAACTKFGWYNRNTAMNPFTIEGKKTAALEIACQLPGTPPDVVVIPTGDGVILSGIAKGFADLRRAGLLERVPRLVAVQPEGSAAIVTALRDGRNDIVPVRGASSVADSLTVEAPRNALLCLRRIRESHGGGVTVTDEAIVASISELASRSGVFGEPAAAASLAGLHAALDEGSIDRGERVVLLVTGNGLKDVERAARSVTRPATIPARLEAVAERVRG